MIFDLAFLIFNLGGDGRLVISQESGVISY